MPAVSSLHATRDGLTQLRRHWAADNPIAAVLLVHGIGEHTGRYEHVGDHFAANGFDVLAADNRGHGQSGGRRGHVDTFDQFLDDVEDLLAERRTLGVPVVLLGHSLGGLISTTYLVSDRPQPDLGVLSAPALGAEVPAWQRIAAPVMSKIAPQLFIKGPIDGSILSRDPEVGTAYTDDPLRVPGATAGLGQAIFTTMEATSASLEQIRVPTYVLHGSADVLVPPRFSEPLAGLEHVTYRSWPELRHECMNEPEKLEVMDEIITWLRAELAA